MNYTTKFNIGDHVWGVSDQDFQRIVKCKPCANTGKITIGDERLICPKCNGRSTHTQYAGRKHYISTFDAEVGQVTVEHNDPQYREYYNEQQPIKVEYMLTSTGVGSGQIWKEENLFESEKDAQAYCDKRNGLLPTDETEHGAPLVGRFGEVLDGAA